MKKYSSLLICLFAFAMAAHANNISPLEEFFFASGKMPVVMVIFAVIVIGIFIYLLMLNKKLSQVKEEINANKP
ncbi:MAG: CcmD family protein [Flavobacteriales bacterium]